MSECPFANFPNMIDPDTYVNGMPYETLHEIRKSGARALDGRFLRGCALLAGDRP